MPSTRRSKMQTRLAFTPLPPSSPQSASLPSHLQTRAASVRYDDSASPAKRRRVLDIAATPKITTVSSPSRLVASAQDSDVASEEDPVMQSPFKRPWSSKVTSSSRRITRGLPTPDPSSQLELEEPGQQSTNSKIDMCRSLTNNLDSDGKSISSDTDSNTILPKARLAQPTTPRSKLRKVRKTQFRARTNSVIEDEETNLLPKHTTRSQARKAIVLSSDEDPGSAPTVSSRRYIDRTPTKPRNGEGVRRTSQTFSNKDQTKEPSSRTKSARMNRRQDLSDSDSTLPDITTLLTPRAAKKQATYTVSDDESDVVVTPRRNGRANKPRPRPISIDQETEESEDVVATPSKRKRLTRLTKQSGRRNTPRKQDDEDLEEDLEVLQDTGKC